MLMMMMMMKKKKGSKETLAFLALFLASANCILPPSTDELNGTPAFSHSLKNMTDISLQGEKYLDKQIENAIDGVKEMKTVMQKSAEDHKKFVDALEKTKLQKEEAIRTAEEMEAKLAKEEEVCNDTMKALWEECKPCLKKTCVKYYSRTCSSGSGLVGRQLEDVLNRTSPFSIWINGERIDTLEQEGQRQTKEFKDLEEKYTEMEHGVDNIFSDSMKVADHMNPPSFFFPKFLAPVARHARSIHMLFHDPFHNFQSMFSPMMGMSRNLFGSMDSMMDLDSNAAPNEDGNVNEDVIITKPFGDGRMTCREIRRNSAGCIKYRNECEKCKEIQHLDCSGQKPLEGPLKEELEAALAMAERFTQRYNSLLRRFEEQMFNTSSVIDMLNKQFGWVSSLANNTKDGIFSVKGVFCKDDTEEKQPADTKVSVQLFDSPPMNFTVPGDIPWTDPKFSEVVAQEALDRYKETSVVVK